MKKIGISACFMYPDPSRTVFGHKTLTYIENDMAKYLSRQGILPVLIPDLAPEVLLPLLHAMDGFVFQGGTDLAPASYGEEPIGRWQGDYHRDQYELQIMDFAMQENKAIFGICRGCQLMNVYFGGTLYQDIATQIPAAQSHRSAELYDKVKHSITWTNGGFLETLYKDHMQPQVNSVHHQAIKDLGKDLSILAHASDGIVEAISYDKAPEGKVFGVQWHPEFSATLGQEIIDPERLLDVFISYL